MSGVTYTVLPYLVDVDVHIGWCSIGLLRHRDEGAPAKSCLGALTPVGLVQSKHGASIPVCKYIPVHSMCASTSADVRTMDEARETDDSRASKQAPDPERAQGQWRLFSCALSQSTRAVPARMSLASVVSRRLDAQCARWFRDSSPESRPLATGVPGPARLQALCCHELSCKTAKRRATRNAQASGGRGRTLMIVREGRTKARTGAWGGRRLVGQRRDSG